MALFDGFGRIARVRHLDCDKIEDRKMKIANGVEGYLRNANGDYKYLYDKGRWYVVSGLYESDGVTPLRGPLPLAKAIEIWLM